MILLAIINVGPMEQSTTDQILKALETYNLKRDGENQYRCNRPWSPGSDSMGLSITIDDPEHGAWYDHVADEGGSLYLLAERLGIEKQNASNLAIDGKVIYNDLVDYARAHGVSAEVFIAAGWKYERYPYDGQDSLRRALRFPTKNGDRWRFLDGKKPKYKSPREYTPCWYGLSRAVEIAGRTDKPLVICNGEPSVVAAQHWDVAACAITSGEKKDIPPELLDELKSAWNAEIILAPDCDETGMRMAAGWVSRLQEAGYQVRAVDLNGSVGFDLANFCALHKENSAAQLGLLKPLTIPQVNDTLEPLDHLDVARPGTYGDRFEIHWAKDTFDSYPAIDFIVLGLISAGSVNLVVGEGGSKKTWAMLDLGVAVAQGEKWLDFQTKQGVVLFVDEESGPLRLRRRLHETLRGHTAQPEIPFAFISLSQINFREINDINALHVLIETIKAQLVIIDALADIMPGADENAVKDVQPIFLALRRIAEITRAAIVIIHHANKVGGYRGSTALKGAVDLMLMVDSKPKSEHITFKVEKARDIEPIQFAAVANFSQDTDQFCLSPSEGQRTPVKLGKSQKYVVRCLEENGASTLPDIIGSADVCSSNSARQAVYALVEMGKVYRTNPDEKGRGAVAIYDLTKDDNDTIE